MAIGTAAMIKIEFVLDVARKDIRFLNDLERNPFQTLMESGIDLSPGEIQGVIDVVRSTSLSNYAPALKKVRALWADLCEEAAVELERLRNKANEEKD